MATMKELSAKCGVSVSTISKALNGYQDISEETRESIIKMASEMGYSLSGNSKTIKMKKTFNIGVLFQTLSNHGLRNEYFAHILASFKEKAARKGYDITFIEHNIGNRKMTYIENCRFRNFDGVFIVCAEFSDLEVLELVNSSYPVVTIDHVFNEAISVLSDNVDGMRQLTQFIIDRGHKKIAYIHGTKSSVTHNRLVSFHNVMAENKIGVPEDYLIEGVYRNAKYCEELALKLLTLPNPPTCIIAPDDYAALGIMNSARKLGLKIPDDISIAGYDGISISQALEPKLTTVKQDTDRIGGEAAKQLINLIESPMTTSLNSIHLKVQLVKGGTVKDINQ